MSDNATIDTILSSNEIHSLHHTFFQPSQPIKATLLVLHGMSEHSGRYEQFAQFLAEQGIAVLTYDHLGHGKTVNSSEELGFFNSEHPMQMVLKDVIQMSEALQAKFAPSNADGQPKVPHFIMGHSMGSFIARNILKHHATRFDGAILMGTADKDPLVKMVLPMVKILNSKAPTKRPEWIANTISKVLNIKAKANSGSVTAWISTCEDNINNYEADPLCGFSFTNNGYYTLFQLMNGALNIEWYRALHKDFPLLITSGQNDPVGNMGKGIDKLVDRLQANGLNKVHKTLYQDMRHEPLNEKNNQLVYQDIADWLLSHS